MRRRARPGLYAALALTAAAVLAPRPALAGEAGEPERAQLRQRLEGLVGSTRSLSWVEDSWERLGSRTESSRERCSWSSDGRWRLEVLAGRGRGAVVSVQGEAVTVQFPSVLRRFKRHYRASDPAVRSLRGHGPREAGFLPALSGALRRWDTVRVRASGQEVVLSFPNAEGLTERMWLQPDSLVPLRTEVYQAGVLVERSTYQQVVLNPR